MSETKEKIKHIPKAEVKTREYEGNIFPETMPLNGKPETITVEIPSQTDTRSGIRQEIAYLQMLMRRYPGPTERFYNEAKS